MIKLKIVDKNNFEYVLKDMKEKVYNLNMEFLDIEDKIDIGNYIFFSEELLDPKYEGYSTSYVFGDLNNKYGKTNIELTDVDVIKVMTNDKYIYLKSIFNRR